MRARASALIGVLKHQQGSVAVAGFASVHWLAAPHSGQRCGSTGVSVMPGLQLHILHPGFQALAEGQFHLVVGALLLGVGIFGA